MPVVDRCSTYTKAFIISEKVNGIEKARTTCLIYLSEIEEPSPQLGALSVKFLVFKVSRLA